MKRLTIILGLILSLCFLTACGDDVVDTNQSEEGKAITKEVGGPFSASEFKKFLTDLPSIPGLTAKSQEGMEAPVNGAMLSAKVMGAVDDLGWEPERFMYIYSHATAMLNIEQMEEMSKQMTAQMNGMPDAQKKMMEQMMAEQIGNQMDAFKADVDKQVPTSEQEIIRDNMDGLYSALGLTKS